MAETQQGVHPHVPIWRTILGDQKSWVLFEHGTCVIFPEPGTDLAAQASEFLSTWGPVAVGTSAADFNVIELDNPLTGWVVTGHSPDVLNYVSPQDVTESEPPDFLVGLYGRGNRDQDAHSLKVIHIEDNRQTVS
ncbi:uncharacterized protein N7482_002992 [Penicillium canariense]|uniref:Uncharacterized protein n=1 Tax=Penicillium canariense TaxID=189055 RepID=A0A9W9IK25_9EURO|nr:uncharacterized protein N7482_002992 [Penicillium canariense]KAJ5177115.1 hypothetical protein N7482_002992 [Penicillium canariense]